MQGDVLSPNLFKLFWMIYPIYFENVTASVNVNNIKIECLIYADDIVVLS